MSGGCGKQTGTGTIQSPRNLWNVRKVSPEELIHAGNVTVDSLLPCRIGWQMNKSIPEKQILKTNLRQAREDILFWEGA